MMVKQYMTIALTREDAVIYSVDVVSVGASDTALVSGTPDKFIKVYAYGYETDGDIEVGFRFATGSKFGRRMTAGPYAQTLLTPAVGGSGEALNFRAEGAVNAVVWVMYVKE